VTVPDPGDLAEVVAYLRGQQLLAAPAELYRRITTLEDNMATAAEQAAAIVEHLNNVDADITRLNEAIAAVVEQVAAKDAELAALLQPVVDQAAALAARTPEPAPPVEG
jgi:hypothetical protein